MLFWTYSLTQVGAPHEKAIEIRSSRPLDCMCGGTHARKTTTRTRNNTLNWNTQNSLECTFSWPPFLTSVGKLMYENRFFWEMNIYFSEFN